MGALCEAFPSAMAASALAQMRIGRMADGEVELVGPPGAIGVFRTRIDDVSRALSRALDRRVRAVLTSEQAAGVERTDREEIASLTIDGARAHPLVATAMRAFDADVSRVDPIAQRKAQPESSR